MLRNSIFSNEDKYNIINMYHDGMSYHGISMYYGNEHSIYVSDDCIRKIIKRAERKSKNKENNIERCLVLSDLHIPYQRDDVLDIVKKHRNNIDAIILAGDIIDCESISVFQSLNKYSLIDEMCLAHKLLYKIQKLTPNIKRYMFFGNHEDRFRVFLSKQAGELSNLHSDNILKEIVDGFYNNKHTKNKNHHKYYLPLDYTVIDKWYMQYHDLIVCHPKSFSKIQGRTAVNACEYFTRMGYDFNALYVAHTHKQAQVYNLGKWCSEIGCLCQNMAYQDSGKLNWTPINAGYAIAEFHNKIFDVNKSQFIHLS